MGPSTWISKCINVLTLIIFFFHPPAIHLSSSGLISNRTSLRYLPPSLHFPCSLFYFFFFFFFGNVSRFWSSVEPKFRWILSGSDTHCCIRLPTYSWICFCFVSVLIIMFCIRFGA